VRQDAKSELAGFAERFSQALKKVGGISEFVRRSGRARATVDRWANAQTAPSLLDLIDIARICGVSLEWLIDGSGSSDNVSKKSDQPQTEVVQIPILDARAEAGAGIENYLDGNIVGYFAFSAAELRSLGVEPANVRALRIDGDSMRPTVADGRMALMDISKRDLIDSKVYVLRAPDGLRAKRIQRKMDGRVVLVSDNKELYAPEEISAADAERITVIGRLFWADNII